MLKRAFRNESYFNEEINKYIYIIYLRKYQTTASRIFNRSTDKISIPLNVPKVKGVDYSQTQFSPLSRQQRSFFLMHPKYAWT